MDGALAYQPAIRTVGQGWRGAEAPAGRSNPIAAPDAGKREEAFRMVAEHGGGKGGNRTHCSVWELGEASSFSTEREHLCLWLPVKGSITVSPSDGGSAYPFAGSSIASIPPGSNWQGSWQGRQRCVLLEIGPLVLREFARGSITFPNRQQLLLLKDERIKLGLMALYQEMLRPTPASDCFIGHIARGIASHYLTAYCSIGTSTWDRKTLSPNELKRVQGAIQERLDEKPVVEDLADMVGLGVASFCRRFRNSTGMPIYQYVLHARVERAKAMICGHDQSLRDLALSLGFYDHSQFTNTFRRIVGMSPREYMHGRVA